MTRIYCLLCHKFSKIWENIILQNIYLWIHEFLFHKNECFQGCLLKFFRKKLPWLPVIFYMKILEHLQILVEANSALDFYCIWLSALFILNIFSSIELWDTSVFNYIVANIFKLSISESFHCWQFQILLMINYILDSLNPISHQQLKIKIKEMIGHSRQNVCIFHVFTKKKSIESMPILNDN